MFVKIAVDSDDELPCIKFSCSNVPSLQKNSGDTASTNTTEISNGVFHGTSAAESADLTTSAGGVITVDSDSSDSDRWKESVFNYNRSLRERCASTVVSSADYAPPSAETDSQSCCSTVTANSPTASKSYGDSEELVSEEQMSQTAASDVNSQTSSVQSDDTRRRKRPKKADDPEAVVLLYTLSRKKNRTASINMT